MQNKRASITFVPFGRESLSSYLRIKIMIRINEDNIDFTVLTE